MTTIIGWVYEQDIHCNDCATKRFGGDLWDNDQVIRDDFWSPVFPLFSYECYDNDNCSDCQCNLD